MRQFITIIAVCLFLSGQRSDAQITQKGLVREFNKNKKPLAGVSVQFFKATSTESDREGKFTLTFERSKEVGNAISLMEVKKNGYELVNETDLQSLTLRADGKLEVDVILAKNGVIDSAKAVYAGASLKALTAGYEREKKNLIAKVNNAKIKEEEYSQQLKNLSEEFEKQKVKLDVLANTFARVNFDDVSPAYKEALELYKNGKLNEAITKLESQNLSKQVQDVLKEIKRIATVEAKLEEDKRLLADKKKQLIEMLSSLADMYNVNFNPIRAEGLMDTLLILDDKDLSILQKTADFYREQHRYEKAFKIYPKIITHPQAEKWRKANANSFLGDLYKTTGNLDKALENYLKDIESYIALYQEDSSSFHKKNLAISYQNLGNTHTSLGNLNKALGFYENYNKLFKELYDAYPNNVDFKNGLAISYSKLGSTHTSLGNLTKALEFYENDLKITKELYEAYPNNVSFKNGLAISYEKLGSTHTSLGNLTKALEFYEIETKLFKELYESYPNNVDFKNGLAISYSKLGSTHTSLGNLNKALEFYEICSKLGKELYESYPNNVDFKNGLAISYAKLSLFYFEKLNNLEKALVYMLSANGIFKELVEISPSNKVFVNYYNLSTKYISQFKETQNLNESQKIFQKIRNEKDNVQKVIIYQSYIQALKTENANAEEITQALNSQAWYSLLTSKFIEAEKLINEGIVLYPQNKFLYTNLPPSLIFQGKIKEATALYQKYAKEPFGEQNLPLYKDAYLSDFKEFEAAGIIPEQYKKEVEKIKKMLNEL